MPELYEQDAKVSDLRAGDVMTQHDNEDITHTRVANVTHKMAWSSIFVEHDTNDLTGVKPLRWRSDGHVRIQRSRPTAEERAATLRELTVDTLRKALVKYLRDNPCDQLSEIVEKGRAYTTGEVLNWSNLADVLSSQALYKQGAKIRAIIHRRSEHDVNVPDDDDVMTVDDDTLLDAWAGWYYENAMRDSAYLTPMNPLSRSTSPLSNVLEDLDRWAIEKVKNDIEWSQGRDELKQRVERMLAEAKAKQQS